MDMERKIPKKLVVLATHEDGVTPKTLDSHYAKDIMYYFDNPEKAPFNIIMGDTFDHVNTLGITAQHKKGNYYGINLLCCVGMPRIYA